MIQVSKFTIGIRPSSKMFRITSLSGSLIDSILELRGSKLIHDNYFSEVSRNQDSGGISLKDESGTNTLRIDLDNIIFTKDHYESEKKLNIETTLNEFHELWKVVNASLKIHDIRRIGLVAEHRFPTTKNNAGKLLLDKLTSLESHNHPAKLTLRYEDRRLTKEGAIPDIKKSNFINVIREYYDSELDIDHPEDDNVNVNIDVQQYYSPLLNGSIFQEIIKLKKVFDEERTKLGKDLKSKGIAK